MSEEIHALPDDRPSFVLGNRTWRTRRKIPYALVRRVLAAMDSDVSKLMAEYENLMRFAICKEQREEFWAALDEVPEDDDDPNTITLDDVSKAGRSLIELMSSAPFRSSSDSSPTPSNVASMSRERSSSEDSTSNEARHVKL